ncbi:MAG: LPS-assembly protein LptD [Chitinophagaceae bacterium]|jgi:hypothetical protein|nr:LPS-assembly protein LptD [Chitinophagaceae bacterium]
MRVYYKSNLKYLFSAALTALLLLTLTWKTSASHISSKYFYIPLTASRNFQQLDTVPKPRIQVTDTLPSRDTIPIFDSVIQIVDTFSLKMSRDSLDGPVTYEAEDSAVVLIQRKQILLYGNTKTQYQDITLTSPYVELDQQSNILTAISGRDSLGEIDDRARFVQGENNFSSDTIRFNFKTQKGLTKNTFTQSGEMFIQGKDIKKVGADTYFVSEGIFTTCNLDEPHFAFKSNKLKLINEKLAISGPTHPEFEGVPIPIYLPFGFYPLSRGQHSGMLAPSFATNEQMGLGLEGLGYYKVLNEFIDVTLRGNIYSYGGWLASFSPTYRKRYKYNGAFNLTVQNTRANFKGDPDFLNSKSFQVNWNHTVDSRARPGTTFGASVNAGSTQFNRLVPNNVNQNFQNQLYSSIRYSKTWQDKPYSLTLSANHSQNNNTRLVNVSLPDAGFTVNTIYPLQPKELIGSPKWYEKLGVGYNGAFRNQIAFYDSAFNFRNLIDTFQWGAQHSIPISLSLPPILGGAIMVSPNVSYSQTWFAQTFHRRWNNINQKVDTVINKGFFTDHSLSTGIGLNTAVFGTYNFKNSNIIAIRHVIRPTLSVNYRPDLSGKHYYDVQVDTTGRTLRFNEFAGGLYSFYGEGEFGGLSFQIDNNIEMKHRNRKDTGEAAIRKIRLIDGFGMSSSYNFFADSLKLQPFNLYLRSTLFEKINISANATLNPYERDSRGRNLDRYVWSSGRFTPGNITNGNIAISTQFQSKPKDSEKEAKKQEQLDMQRSDPALVGDQQRLLEYMQQNPNEFVDFNIPWTLGLSFSLNFFEQLRPDYSGFSTEFSSDLRFNGSFNLTEKWNFSADGYYNLNTRELQTFQMSISRDLHCWQMSISVAPVGLFRYFSININPKSALLQDLKVNRTRSFQTF